LYDNALVGFRHVQLSLCGALHGTNIRVTQNGTLPDEISHLEALRVLYLDSNHFTGSIPDSIVRLNSLGKVALWIKWNRKVGTNTLPFSESLYLFGNGLNGTLPQHIQVMTSLQQLRLDSNSLSGTVPYGLGFLSDLGKIQTIETSVSSHCSSPTRFVQSFCILMTITCQEMFQLRLEGWN
jgi:Leucine Rich Repeat